MKEIDYTKELTKLLQRIQEIPADTERGNYIIVNERWYNEFEKILNMENR